MKSFLTENLVRFVPSQSHSTKDQSESDRTKQKEAEFKLKYLPADKDPRKRNLIQNLIKNFNIDKKFYPVNFFMSMI